MFKRFAAGLAVGYVLGARSGEERYEQIVDVARKISRLPGVREAVDAGPGTVSETGQSLVSMIRERARDLGDRIARGNDDRQRSGDGSDDEAADVDAFEYEGEPEDEDDDGDDDSSAERTRADADDGGDEDDDGDEGSNDPAERPRRPIASSLAEIASAALERGRVA